MMEMKEQTGSRKKYLAPVVVLMLCLVALTGAAYAYQSTVTVTDNVVSGEEYVLQVYDNQATPAELNAPITVKGMDLTHATTIGATTKNVIVSANTITSYSYIGKLTIKDTDQVSKTGLAMAITANATVQDGSLTAAEVNERASVSNASGGPITYTVTVGLYTAKTCANNEAYGGTLDTDANGMATLWYKVTMTGSGSIAFTNSTDTVTSIANVQTGLAGEHFTLSFAATAPGTA